MKECKLSELYLCEILSINNSEFNLKKIYHCNITSDHNILKEQGNDSNSGQDLPKITVINRNPTQRLSLEWHIQVLMLQ